MNTNLTRHEKIIKTQQKTRHKDTNILKLHELQEKYVNFYKTPKHELTRKKIRVKTKWFVILQRRVENSSKHLGNIFIQ